MKIHGYLQANSWIPYKELYQMGMVVLYGNIRTSAIELIYFYSAVNGGWNVLNEFMWVEVLRKFTYICTYVPLVPSYSTELYLFCLLFLTLQASCTQNVLICTSDIQICNFIFLQLISCPPPPSLLKMPDLAHHRGCDLSCFKNSPFWVPYSAL